MHEIMPYRISVEAIPAALEKSRQYRSLLEPEQAESICLDILQVDQDNHDAMIILILALTDQFSLNGKSLDVKRVQDVIKSLPDEYERVYYTGLVSERRGRAMLQESMSRSFAYDFLCEAMHLFERAVKVRPKKNDDAILRWNSCLRSIRRERLQPRLEKDEIHLNMES